MFCFSVIQYDVCSYQPYQEATGYTYQTFYVMSDSKCIEKCLEQKASNPNASPYIMNMITYDGTNCYCVYNGGVWSDYWYGSYLRYCYIDSKQFLM